MEKRACGHHFIYVHMYVCMCAHTLGARGNDFRCIKFRLLFSQ